MAKQRFKFFKPVATGEKPDKKAISIVALLLTFSVILGYAGIVSEAPMSNLKADPAVWDAIINGESITVTIAYKGELTYGGLTIYKQWKFGELGIVYARAGAETLKQMVDDENILRISAWKKIGLPPHSYIVKNEGVSYDFSKDYKRIYHKANDRWTGKGVTIAVIDTGVDYLHPDFFRNGKTVIKALVSTIYRTGDGEPLVYGTVGFTREQMEDVLSYEEFVMDATNSDEYPFEDVLGHGTHVAGIIAGQGVASNENYKGIAPGANLVVIKSFLNEGYATEETILDALQWIYDHAEEYNIKILSCSWGSPPLSTLADPTELAMEQLVKDKGVYIFSASGNEGALPTTIISPARDPYVFAVGAVDPYTDKLAVFSSIGEPLPPPLNQPDETKPDFVGAGVNIIAPASRFAQFPDYAIIHGNGGDYVIMSGTSMATPADSATFATFYQMYLELNGRPPTEEDFIQYVREKGIVYNLLGKDFITGWGAPTVPAPG